MSDTPELPKPLTPSQVSAYMSFIGKRGAAAARGKHNFTSEHQQRAAAARWSRHEQRKEQLINESQDKQNQEKQESDRRNGD